MKKPGVSDAPIATVIKENAAGIGLFAVFGYFESSLSKGWGLK